MFKLMDKKIITILLAKMCIFGSMSEKVLFRLFLSSVFSFQSNIQTNKHNVHTFFKILYPHLKTSVDLDQLTLMKTFDQDLHFISYRYIPG